MTFAKKSIAVLAALAAGVCFAENYSEIVSEAVKGLNAEKGDFGAYERNYKKAGEAVAAASKAGAPDSKDRVDFSKAVCAELSKAKEKTEKVFLISLLQMTGGEESLSTLEKLLSDKDKDIQDAARMALEKNSSPKASKILTARVTSQKDSALVSGLVNSLAERGDSVDFVNKAKKAKDKNIVNAANKQGGTWQVLEFASFYDQFSKKPSKELASKAISNGCDRAFVLVAPYVLEKQPGLISQFRNRFKNSENPTKAWVLTSLAGCKGKEAVNFMIEAGKEGTEDCVQMAACYSLSTVGGEASAKAVFDILKNPVDDKNKVRNWAENAIAAMPADKAIDKFILDNAKNKDRAALRLIACRGVYEGLPLVMEFLEKNVERGDCCWVLEQMGMDDNLVGLAEIAITQNNDYLIGRIVPVANQISKRVADIEGTNKKLEALKAKANDKAKTALDRAILLVANRGELPEKKR